MRNVYLTHLVNFTFVSKNKTYIQNKRQFEFLPYKLQISCMYGIFKESMCNYTVLQYVLSRKQTCLFDVVKSHDAHFGY